MAFPPGVIGLQQLPSSLSIDQASWVLGVQQHLQSNTLASPALHQQLQ